MLRSFYVDAIHPRKTYNFTSLEAHFQSQSLIGHELVPMHECYHTRFVLTLGRIH